MISNSKQTKSFKDGLSVLEILISVAIIALMFPPVFELLFYIARPAFTKSVSGPSIFDHESINKKHMCEDLLSAYSSGSTGTIIPKSIIFKSRSELGLSTSSTSTVTGISAQNFLPYSVHDVMPSFARGQSLFISTNSSSTTEPDIYNIGNGQHVDTGPGITSLKQFGPYLIAANSGVKNQVQIIRKDNMSVYKTFTIPGSSSATNPITRSFTIARGVLFVGTEKSVLPEIFIFDLRTGSAISSIETGYGVNDLYVLDNFLFVASPRDPELEVYDISNMDNANAAGGESALMDPPRKVVAYDAPGGSGNGKVFDAQDGQLLFGRTKGGNEFLSLRLLDPSLQPALQPKSPFEPAPPSTLQIEPSVAQKIGWSVDKVIPFKDYVLLLTSDPQKEIQLYKYQNHAAVSGAPNSPGMQQASLLDERAYSLIYSYDLPARATDFACAGNTVYVSNQSIDAPLAVFEF